MGMKGLRCVFVSFFVLWTAGAGAEVPVITGVSHELAQTRINQVSDVSYHLSFDLPSSPKAPVTGTVEIHFMWKGQQGQKGKAEPLQLDFQGSIESPIVVNDKQLQTEVRDEHIVIPSRLLSPKRQNKIAIRFVSGDKALNRNADYMYTLFVPDHARSAFPCFDQPDIKARYELTLTLPETWTAISNAPMTKESLVTEAPSDKTSSRRKTCRFGLSDPLPTYLFSFTAGQFQQETSVRDGREITILHRETDAAKVAQLPVVFDQAALALRWMESYTGIRQPFQKHAFVILPGYQFGGMEHPGCIQLRDQSVFLGKNPTPDEEMDRLHLIAHETAHLWFGDLVTMRWFNDVWTKEVFANFMADKIAREQFPDINHDINFLKTHYLPALATERTEGTHAIQQTLDNLNNAGLLYGNIIYHKAPIMMRKLEERMGEGPFREGLKQYLQKYSYANATWDDLIGILDQQNPQAGIRAFDRQWVKQAGVEDCDMMVSGRDFDPMTYGRYRLSETELSWLLANWHALSETRRFAAMMYLYESWLHHKVDNRKVFDALFEGLRSQDNRLVRSSCIDYLLTIVSYSQGAEREDFEKALFAFGRQTTDAVERRLLLQGITRIAITPAVADSVYRLWYDALDPTFDKRDYMRMAYHQAVLRPDRWQEILVRQRSRLSNADMLREFDFVSRGCSPDPKEQMRLFESLLQRENRATEPFASALLALLNDPLREPLSNRYITPGLEVLEEVQRTGDIFFPLSWCNALLGGHRSEEAARQVQVFLNAHPDYPSALRGKLLQAAFMLRNTAGRHTR